MPLHRYGTGSDAYFFPRTLGNYSDNFASVVRRTTRLPGLSGGFDPNGLTVAPREVGDIRQELTIVAPNVEAMDGQRETVRRMATWGTRPLFYRPTDYGLRPERWCMAAINDVQMPHEYSEHGHIWQRVTLSFQVADPRWYSNPPYAANALVWDGGTWDLNTWGWGTPAALSASGVTTFTRVQRGILPTQPDITLRTGAGQVINNPVMRLYFNSILIDELIWTGTVPQNSILSIACRSRTVLLNGASAYSGLTWKSIDWFVMPPGTSTIEIYTASGDAGTVEYGAPDVWI